MKNLIGTYSKNVYLILLVSLFGYNFGYGQNSYYVSLSGSDFNGGRSPADAFKSVNKINSLILRPGDKVFFRKGDTFYGRLTINGSGTEDSKILISSFGKGRLPVINAGELLTNWKKRSGNIWEANSSNYGTNVTGVYINTKAAPLGRYPNLKTANSGYLTVKWHENRSTLMGLENFPGDFTGGEIVVRSMDYVLDRISIDKQVQKMFVLNANTTAEVRNGNGFFLQNHPGTLDQQNEWCYMPQLKKVMLYSSANPNSRKIEASLLNTCIELNGKTNVVIENIELRNGKNFLLHGRNVSGITIRNCKFANGGEDGIVLDGGGRDITIESCVINGINNNGVNIKNYNKVLFWKNTIKNVGCVAGMGRSGDGQYKAFQYTSQQEGSTHIKNNRIDSVGYVGIEFNASNVLVKNNYISNFDLVLNDGGGIYTWNGNHNERTNQIIEGNIVTNAFGATAGTLSKIKWASGIYVDDCSKNLIIRKNAVINCGGSGIYLHGVDHVSITDNIGYNNGTQLLVRDANRCQCGDANISNNIFFSVSNNQTDVRFEKENRSVSYSRFDNINYSANRVNQKKGSTQTVAFKFNETGASRTVTLNGQYRNLKDNKVYKTVTLPPFTASVFVK